MSFPHITALTAGVTLVLQILLALAVSGRRQKHGAWLGAGGHEDLARAVRRHANLAENAGLFVAGFTLLELSGWRPAVLLTLCPAFVAVRLAHAAGMTRPDTNNALRRAGGAGTFLIGLALGGSLVWLSASRALGSYL